MTIEKKITEWLAQQGMFPQQADAVLEILKAEDVADGGAMKDRWNDESDGYPPQLLPVLIPSARRAGLAWIDANLPKAWFRSLFVEIGASQ